MPKKGGKRVSAADEYDMNMIMSMMIMIMIKWKDDDGLMYIYN